MLPRVASADDGPDWVVAAHRSLFIGDGSLVVGDVAAQAATSAPWLADSADVTLGSGTTVHGDVWGDAISVRGTPAIYGVVHYLTSVAPAPSTFPAGALDDSLALPLELMDIAPPDFPTDTPDPAITIASSSEVELGDGNYAAVTLEAGTAESGFSTARLMLWSIPPQPMEDDEPSDAGGAVMPTLRSKASD